MVPKRRRADPKPAAAVDLASQLGAVLSELGLTEIEASWGEVRVRLQRSGAPSAPASLAAGADHPLVADVGLPSAVTVEAPMVGTFYRASSPTAAPYVSEDDVVKEGQILCIIEAMKLMNEIETRAGGRIVKILVENGHAVEYGQPLFLIEPMR